MSLNRKKDRIRTIFFSPKDPDPVQGTVPKTTIRSWPFYLAALLILSLLLLPFLSTPIWPFSAYLPSVNAQSSIYAYDSIEALANDDSTIIFQISGRSVGNDIFDYMASHLASINGVSHVGNVELIESPGYCNHGYTRRFVFTYHDRNHIIENCDYGGYESIAQDAADFMNNRPEGVLGHLDAISVKFCPYDSTESSVNPPSELIQILEDIHTGWQNHNADAHDNLNLVYWTLVPTLHSQWHDPNNDSFPSVYHQPVNEHIKQNLADPQQGIVAFDVWSRLVEGSQHSGFMNPSYAVSSDDNHLNDAGNDVLMRAFLTLLDEWFGQPSFPREDINQDNLIDILDLQLIINVSINVPTDPALRSRADINSDGVVNETDIEAFLQALFQYR